MNACNGNTIRAIAGTLAVMAVVTLLGCEPSNPPQPSAAPQPAVNNPPPAPPAAVPKTPEPVKKKADVGVGAKGRGYGQGVVATPTATLFAVKERLIFQDLIPHAMDLFKATEGRAPKDHDEFMEKIIKANNIHLPELPEGDRYRYDPKTEQLMVESPAPE